MEIKEGREWVKRTFDRMVIKGDDDLTIRKNFDYSRNFTKADRMKAAKLQAEGKVRLLSYRIDVEPGRSQV